MSTQCQRALSVISVAAYVLLALDYIWLSFVFLSAGLNLFFPQGIDLDADFDPEQHDAAMNNVFDQAYYNEDVGNSGLPEIEDEELRGEWF